MESLIRTKDGAGTPRLMLTLTYSNIFLLVFLSFAFGYVIGRVDLLYVRLASDKRAEPAPYAPVQGNTLRAAMQDVKTLKAGKIEIDTGKYVGEINTGGMQKTQDVALGKTTQTQDDINSSVSKLAQLKGK